MKRLFMLAGANGSGKSTIAKVLLPSEGIGYVNPDDIARELNPQDLTAVRVSAGREALHRIDDLMTRGESFAIESTLSGLAYVRKLEQARRMGYETILAYVYVDSAEVCIARIAARVRSGGHPVPNADVRRRYGKAADIQSFGCLRLLLCVSRGAAPARGSGSDKTAPRRAGSYIQCFRSGRACLSSVPDRR